MKRSGPSRRLFGGMFTPRPRSASRAPIAGAASASNLFARIVAAASNHGVETIDIVCMPDNVGMIRLAQKFKAHFTFEENMYTGRLTARRPTAFSMLSEISHDMMDYTASMFDRQIRALSGG